jgi:GT2 family glycosyltransferase
MEREGGIVLVRNSSNLGYAKATNQGLDAGLDAEYQLLLNNDTLALDGWLDALVDDLDVHPEADIAGSLLLYPEGDAIQHAGMVAGRCRGELKVVHRWQLRSLRRTPEALLAGNVDAVTGASLLVRTSAIRRFGALSEEYRNGFEDLDFCFRLGAADRAVRYVPASRLIHLESRTPGRRSHEDANAALFKASWGTRPRVEADSGFDTILREVRLRKRLERHPADPWVLARLARIVRPRGDGEADELVARISGTDVGWLSRSVACWIGRR